MSKTKKIFYWVGGYIVCVLIYFAFFNKKEDISPATQNTVITAPDKSATSTSDKTATEQPKAKKYVFSNGKAVEVDETADEITCSKCNGTGIYTCQMCGGTGTNNLGATCGCVTYVLNCEKLGKTPSRTALRWSCEYCNGTGSIKIK